MKVATDHPGRPDLHVGITQNGARIGIFSYGEGKPKILRFTPTEALAVADALVDCAERLTSQASSHQTPAESRSLAS